MITYLTLQLCLMVNSKQETSNKKIHLSMYYPMVLFFHFQLFEIVRRIDFLVKYFKISFHKKFVIHEMVIYFPLWLCMMEKSNLIKTNILVCINPWYQFQFSMCLKQPRGEGFFRKIYVNQFPQTSYVLEFCRLSSIFFFLIYLQTWYWNQSL